jgi:oxygen-independent coproporphyrinogen-3 oxidase
MEVTMECNPDDISDEFCNVLRQLPVNRISMGVQTFSDDRLRFLHRRHTVKQVEEAVKRIRDCGIKNISIDLMFGFPNEKISEWEEDIRHALSLNVEHISAYSLMYDEGTRLDEMRKQHLLKELDEEVSLQMYEMLMDKLTLAGYEHYEISNFALPGYRSRHNSSYWQNTPYIGIGAAAHSYDLHKRQWNIADIREYMDSIEKGIIPCEYEVIDEDMHYNDLITTALRTKEGICLNVLPDKYKSYLTRNAQRHIENQSLAIDDGRLHLTRKGIFVSDDIMSDLIFV